MEQVAKEAAKIALGSFHPICNTFRESDGKPVSIYDDQDMLDIFQKGVEWQRNHVWHDISEKPTEAKADLMIDNKYWCYLEDIIPTNR